MVAVALCLVGRALHVFTLSWVANKFRPSNRQITRPMQVLSIPGRSVSVLQILLWFSGLRGAIAFGLALNMPETPNKNVVVTTTLVIVLASTAVLGAAVEPMLHVFRLTEADSRAAVRCACLAAVSATAHAHGARSRAGVSHRGDRVTTTRADANGRDH